MSLKQLIIMVSVSLSSACTWIICRPCCCYRRSTTLLTSLSALHAVTERSPSLSRLIASSLWRYYLDVKLSYFANLSKMLWTMDVSILRTVSIPMVWLAGTKETKKCSERIPCWRARSKPTCSVCLLEAAYTMSWAILQTVVWHGHHLQWPRVSQSINNWLNIC